MQTTTRKIQLLYIVLPKSKDASLFYFGQFYVDSTSSASAGQTSDFSFFYGDIPFFSTYVTYTVEVLQKSQEDKPAPVPKNPNRTYIMQTSSELLSRSNQVLTNTNAKYSKFCITQKFVQCPKYAHHVMTKIVAIECVAIPRLLASQGYLMEYLLQYAAYHQFQLPSYTQGMQLFAQYYKTHKQKADSVTALWDALNTLMTSGEFETLHLENLFQRSISDFGFSLAPTLFVERWQWLYELGYTSKMFSLKRLFKAQGLYVAGKVLNPDRAFELRNVNTRPLVDGLYMAMLHVPHWFMTTPMPKGDTRGTVFSIDLREQCNTFHDSLLNPFLFPFKSSDNTIFAWTGNHLISSMLPYMLRTQRMTAVQKDMWTYVITAWHKFYKHLQKEGSDHGRFIKPLKASDHPNATPEWDLKAYMLLTQTNLTVDPNGMLNDLPLWITNMKPHFDSVLNQSLCPIIAHQDVLGNVYHPRDQFVAKQLIGQAFRELLLSNAKWTGAKRGTKDPNLTKEQQDALDAIDTFPLVIITGGPGTGKSFLINKIIQKYSKECVHVLAYIGCVVSHLRHEAEVVVANTIDSSYRDKTHIKKEIVIIDEAAMLDNRSLAMALMINRHVQRRLIFIADENQIGPIGLGNPYMEVKSLCQKWSEGQKRAQIHALTKNFRLTEGELSPLHTLQLMYKQVQILPSVFTTEAVQFHYITKDVSAPASLARILGPLIQGKDKPVLESVVVFGLLVETTRNVNHWIDMSLAKQWYNHDIPPARHEKNSLAYYYVGQRIMVVQFNVYEIMQSEEERERIYNGEMYYIEEILCPEAQEKEEQTVWIDRNSQVILKVASRGRRRLFHVVDAEQKAAYTQKLVENMKQNGKRSRIPIFVLEPAQLSSAWSITVNKAQGSEYDHTIFVVEKSDDVCAFTTGHGLVALSRAKKRLDVIIPDVHVLHRLGSHKCMHRASDLAQVVERALQ